MRERSRVTLMMVPVVGVRGRVSVRVRVRIRVRVRVTGRRRLASRVG